MFFYYFTAVITLSGSHLVSSYSISSSTFLAAVYELYQYGDNIPIDSRVPADIINENLRTYKTAIKDAASHGSEIIVFPEEGLYPTPNEREEIRKYA